MYCFYELMRNLFSLYKLCIFFSILLTSCTQQNKTIRIGFSQCTGGEWREQLNQEILSEAKFYDNLKVDIKNASGNIQQQLEDIKSFVAENVDLLIISPLEDSTLIDAFNSLDFQNIPVLLVDRKISSNKYVSFVGASNWEVGVQAAKYVLQLRSDKQTRILHIRGFENSTATIERELGFVNTLRKYENMEVQTLTSGQDLGGKNVNSTIRILNDNISLLTSVDVIYAYNDAIAIAAYDLLKKANTGHMPIIIGVDGMLGYKKGVNAVMEGTLAATVVYPTGGAKVIDVGMKIINHISVPKENLLSIILIDKSNVQAYYLQGQDIVELRQKINLLQQEKITQKNQYREIVQWGIVTISILLGGWGIFIVLLYIKKRKNKSALELQDSGNEDNIKKENEDNAQFEERVLYYIKEHYMDYDCDLSILINELAISKINFYKQFKLTFKDTPNNFLKRFRLDKAKELILEGKYTYAEIGYKVGFSSPAYFTKCFKEEFNMTPSQYFEKKIKKNIKIGDWVIYFFPSDIKKLAEVFPKTSASFFIFCTNFRSNFTMFFPAYALYPKVISCKW